LFDVLRLFVAVWNMMQHKTAGLNESEPLCFRTAARSR